MPSNVTSFNIRDVWKNNMGEEFAKIRDIIENYPYVAMVSCVDFIGSGCLDEVKQRRCYFKLSLTHVQQ